MSVVVTDLPSLDWVRDVPPDISVRLIGTTAAKIKVALWCEAANSNACLEYGAHENPSVAVAAAVAQLRGKAAMEQIIREAQTPKLRLIN